MFSDPSVNAAAWGAIAAIPTTILTAILAEPLTHKIRTRLERGQAKTDAIANLEMAFGQVEDSWQPRPGSAVVDERERRLEELRDVITTSRVQLGKSLHKSLFTCYEQAVTAAKQQRAVDVRRAAQEGLRLLDKQTTQWWRRR